MMMGGPDLRRIVRRAKALTFAAGVLVMCLGNLDCQAGVIIFQPEATAQVELGHASQAAVSDLAAGQSEGAASSPALPVTGERELRLKSSATFSFGESGGASNPMPVSSSQGFTSFASHSANELLLQPAAAIYAHWREISPSLAAGERMEQLDPPRH